MTSIFTFIRGLSVWASIGSVVVALALGYGVFKAWEYKNFREGVQHERSATEKVNETVIKKGNSNAATRRECVDAYGVDAWDVTDGMCYPERGAGPGQ